MSDNYTPKNEWEVQYEREYKRITQAIRRQKKLGYFVPEDVKPLPPSKVKVISPTLVEKLIDLTPKEIRKQSVWVDQETGEAHQGLDIVKSRHTAKPSTTNITETKGRRKKKQIQEPTQRKSRKKKKKEPENTAPPKENNLNMQIVDSITEMIERWQPSQHWNTLWLERKTTIYITIRDKWFETLNKEGAYQVAYRMENNALLYNHMVDRLIHGSDDAVEDSINLNTFITFLTNETLTAEESDAYSTYAMEYIRDSLMGDSFG